MGKLTEERYLESFWDFRRKVYELDAINYEQKKEPSTPIVKFLSKSSFGRKILEYSRSYYDYLLWDIIYRKYLPKTRGAKVLEVGSAPGDYLVRLNQTFGFIPYGIEHSYQGVELNRKIFRLHNINPDNVIHADFFSDEFQKQYNRYFDIVVSGGFIEEHPDIEVKDVIEKHIDLLVKGGYLIVCIPNLTGVYYLSVLLFGRHLLSSVNFDIMRKEKFSELFNKERLSTLFCDYYGTFSCGNKFSPIRNTSLRFILDSCDSLQRILNIAFRLIFKDKGAESSLFSPYLLYIGKKIG